MSAFSPSSPRYPIKLLTEAITPPAIESEDIFAGAISKEMAFQKMVNEQTQLVTPPSTEDSLKHPLVSPTFSNGGDGIRSNLYVSPRERRVFSALFQNPMRALMPDCFERAPCIHNTNKIDRIPEQVHREVPHEIMTKCQAAEVLLSLRVDVRHRLSDADLKAANILFHMSMARSAMVDFYGVPMRQHTSKRPARVRKASTKRKHAAEDDEEEEDDEVPVAKKARSQKKKKASPKAHKSTVATQKEFTRTARDVRKTNTGKVIPPNDRFCGYIKHMLNARGNEPKYFREAAEYCPSDGPGSDLYEKEKAFANDIKLDFDRYTVCKYRFFLSVGAITEQNLRMEQRKRQDPSIKINLININTTKAQQTSNIDVNTMTKIFNKFKEFGWVEPMLVDGSKKTNPFYQDKYPSLFRKGLMDEIIAWEDQTLKDESLLVSERGELI